MSNDPAIDQEEKSALLESVEAVAQEETITIPILGIEVPKAGFPLLVAGLVACLALGWAFLRQLPAIWFEDEGYYSHGILIPFMSLAVVYMRRERIRGEPIVMSWFGFPILVIGLLMVLAGQKIDNISFASGGFIVSLIGGSYFVFGSRVTRHVVGPLLFLAFMMPVLGWIIDSTTNPLQLISTKVAAKLLTIFGFNAEIPAAYPTLILMDNYSLYVGGPCSGFKLILSLTAFTMFFVMISNLGLWKNLLLVFVINPALALLINGLRIMLIGIVGERSIITPDAAWVGWMRSLDKTKDDVGMIFHDYSGYVTLIVCFIVLHYIVRGLEGKHHEASA